MSRIVRFLAVVALALSPVWGVPAVHAASSHTPYWPSFDSSGCNAAGDGQGGVVIACGTGGFVTTQITSAYGGCSQIDLNVSAWGSGPVIAVATAPVGGLQSTVTINSYGDYFMQLSWMPSTIVGPIQLQLSAPDTANYSLSGLTVNPCPVPTSTPTASNTSTPNPSDTVTSTPTVTATPTPGPSHTLTPIPTNTPLPSGHNTFTPTVTNTPPAPTSTGTATATPGPSYRQCGIDYPMLNCDMVGGAPGVNPPDWSFNTDPTIVAKCLNGTPSSPPAYAIPETDPGPTAGFEEICQETVTPLASGELWVRYQSGNWPTIPFGRWRLSDTSFNVDLDTTSCPTYSGTYCTAHFGNVTSGTPDTFQIQEFGGGANVLVLNLAQFWVSSTSNTPTPAPTNSVTNTNTPVPGTSTATVTPTLTPVPIPGSPETPIPTDTECPGGCAVAKLTAIPGMSTRVTVDTSPFDPLKNMSLARSSCVPFGYLQIPVPHIIGTPAFGSTTPLSYTWTTPITGPWDNSIISGSIVLTNTALQPCGMSEIPTFVWDLTYWLSVIMLAVGWFLWLIGFVGRLSGEETING